MYISCNNQIKRGRIKHHKWKIKKAKPRIIKNAFLDSYSLGIQHIFNPEFCHISDGVEVDAWPLEDVR